MSNTRLAKVSHDSAGRPLRVTREDNSNASQLRVGFAYDGFSQLRSLIRLKHEGLSTEAEVAHTAEYDRQGRTIRTVDANSKESTAAYEPYCVGSATTSARGVRRKTSFDTLCRLTEIEVGTPDANPLEVASASETRSFLYDDLGRLVQSTQSTSGGSVYGQAVFGQSTYGNSGAQAENRTYVHDSLDRLKKLVFEDGKEMSYLHDEEGNVTQITENASSATPKVTQFSYYGDNRLHEVTYVRSSGNQKFSYAYDPGGRPLTLTYPASTGIVAHFSGPNSEIGWDGNGQLLHLRYMKGATTVRRFEFQYDDAGNRIEQLDVKGIAPVKATKWAYGYDWLDRLESVKKAEADIVANLGALQLVSMHTYDAADNRIEFKVPNLSDPALDETFTYAYKYGDEIESISKAVGAGSPSIIETFTSDADGNLKTRLSGGVTTTYNWTDHNRLASISTTDNSKKQTNTFGVNGFRRKKKDKNDVETTEYAAGLATAVSKVQGDDTVTYLMGHRLMGLERESDGEMFYFICDSLSSIRDVVSSSGNVVASYEFSEYGERIASSESGVSSHKTYVGGMSVQDEVSDTGLMLMGHRLFDPSLGRFLNRDPIGFAGGLNLFSYGANNPTTMTDHTGLQPVMPTPVQQVVGTFRIYVKNAGPIDLQNLEASIHAHGFDVEFLYEEPGYRGYRESDNSVGVELEYLPNEIGKHRGQRLLGQSCAPVDGGWAKVYGGSLKESLRKRRREGVVPSGLTDMQVLANMATFTAKHEIMVHHSGQFVPRKRGRVSTLSDRYEMKGYLESNDPQDVMTNSPMLLSPKHELYGK